MFRFLCPSALAIVSASFMFAVTQGGGHCCNKTFLAILILFGRIRVMRSNLHLAAPLC